MFKLSSVFAALALVGFSTAAVTPLKRADDSITDVQILNYALTLEHLEASFYSGALAKFDDKAFADAGFPSWVRGRFNQVASHEAAHVQFLQKALGDQATEACAYSFPYTDPKSFAALSAVLEGVGVSAYLGAAASIKNKDYLTAAGSILTTESRHQAWISSAVNKGSPWSGPLDTPLDFNQVYSLAAPFITSCPPSNPKLPVKAFPSLAVSGTLAPGSQVSLTFDSSKAPGQLYLALFDGLATSYITIAADKKVTLPVDAQGTIYGVVTSSGTAVADSNTIAGVAILNFPFDSHAQN